MNKEEALAYIDAERSRLNFNIDFYNFCDNEGNKQIALEKIRESQEKIAHYKSLLNVSDDESIDFWEPEN